MLATVFEHEDSGAQTDKLELVRHKDDAFVLEGSKNTIIENAVGNRGVNCAQWVVQEVDVRVLVDSTS